MCGLCNKVSNPLNVRHTLDCIATNTDYLSIHSQVYGTQLCNKYLNRKQTRDVPATKCKIEFSKVLQSLYTEIQNQKSNLIYLFIHLVKVFVLILHSKIVFK